MGIETLKAALDELVECDPFELEDPEAVVDLLRQLSRFEAVTARAVAAFDTSGAWGSDGAKSATAWIATRCRLPGSVATRHLRRGRALRHLSSVSEAFGSGEINGSHVDGFVSARNSRTEAALERDEELLVRQATRLRFEHFTRALAYWEQHADPDGAEDSEAARIERRDVYLSATMGGTFLGRMNFDAIGGTIVSVRLDAIEQEFFEADWAEATERLGREPKVGELRRTPGQRRADAMVEMAIRAGTAPEHGRRPEPLFTVLVDYATLAGRVLELAQGQALTPGSLVPWLDQAQVERAVFEPSGRVEVSCTARLFTGATRRAIEIRDRECTHPFCDEPSDRCQVDHIIPWTQGGPTTQENGRLLCGFHNRLRNGDPPPPEEEPL